MFMKEIWKDIPNYEGIYQVSNTGIVKSLQRVVYRKCGRKLPLQERVLSPQTDKGGYLYANLYKNNKLKAYKIHQLVSMAFLNHKTCGMELVVNHKDFNKTNNNVNNLEIVTSRQNTNKRHLKSQSKYTGVSWHKATKKWVAQIHLNGKRMHLGLFKNEYDAHLKYEECLDQALYLKRAMKEL